MSLDVAISKTVGSFHYGFSSLTKLESVIAERRRTSSDYVLYVFDQYFKNRVEQFPLGMTERDISIFVDCSDEELTTEMVDQWTSQVKQKKNDILPCAIVAFGGGSALDAGKAVSNLLTNGGSAQDYQGWNLVRVPGVYKIGIPTLSGTGAEASRTCVLKNKAKNIKLGMNSPFSVFDHLVLDPSLSKTVDRDQYFFTAMDTYIHCIESLRGHFRHPIADAYSLMALNLVREVMNAPDMMSDECREKVMIASYFGGSAIGNSFVGVVHPLSAGLSTVFGTHHCVANCIVMKVMEGFYPEETEEFLSFCKKQKVTIPSGVCSNADDHIFEKLYSSSTVHEKPLTNALGPDFKQELSFMQLKSLYQRM